VIDAEGGPTLYDISGNIEDCNTMLVNRAQLRRLLPWWRKLPICWSNYKKFKQFRLNMGG